MSTGRRLSELRHSLRHPLVRAGLAATALLVPAAVVVIAMWWPLHEQKLQLEEEVTALTESIRDRAGVAAAAAAYTRSKQGAALLEAKLKHAATQAQLVDDLSRLARANGVRIVSETYEEIRRPSGQALLNADLVVRGSYASTRKFLQALSTLPTWSEIDEVTLEKGREPNTIAGKLRIVTYRAP